MTIRQEEKKMRAAIAIKLREEGLTYKDVGIQLGVGPTRARQIILAHERDELEKSEWHDGLTRRTLNLLRLERITSKEQALDYFKNGNFLKIPGLGYVTYKEILAWLGVEEKVKQKPIHKDHTIQGAIIFLENNGYTVIKKK